MIDLNKYLTDRFKARSNSDVVTESGIVDSITNYFRQLDISIMPSVKIDRKDPTRVAITWFAPKPAPSRKVRGNSYSRRARRLFLINKFGIRTKAGKLYWVLCHHCGKRMRAGSSRWEVDRWPICGHAGGRYTRDNIVISCQLCNRGRCSRCPR